VARLKCSGSRRRPASRRRALLRAHLRPSSDTCDDKASRGARCSVDGTRQRVLPVPLSPSTDWRIGAGPAAVLWSSMVTADTYPRSRPPRVTSWTDRTLTCPNNSDFSTADKNPRTAWVAWTASVWCRGGQDDHAQFRPTLFNSFKRSSRHRLMANR